VVDVSEIEYIVAKMARIPPKQVSASDRDVLKNLERNLEDGGVRAGARDRDAASAIKMARSGLANPPSPSAASCSRARPASARPRSRASSRSSSGSS
jgi:ATP-dependent Clp protease ATP-binding subunit ClpA